MKQEGPKKEEGSHRLTPYPIPQSGDTVQDGDMGEVDKVDLQ